MTTPDASQAHMGLYEAGGHAHQYNAPHGVVNVYHAAPTLSHRPWMAPALDSGLVPRPELSEPLLELVCSDSAGPVVGLHGTGGFGKTTLAIWSCHHPLIRSRFLGGLLWVTIGEHTAGPDLAGRINDLVEQLTGSRPAFTDPAQASFRLGAILDAQPQPVLLVVDDVWTEAQLTFLLVGGQNCRRLVTTRHRRLISAKNRLAVDRMSVEQATALLTRGAPEAIRDQLIKHVLDRTGRWPVLLNLANRAMVRSIEYGTTPARALHDIGERLAADGPPAFDEDEADQHASRAVAGTVQAGLYLLPVTYTDRFTELVIFGEGIDIPLSALELLWGTTGGLTASGVRRVCEAFADLSLVMAYQAEHGTIRLHDVIREYLLHRSEPDGRAQLHQRLLDAATIRTLERSCWWTLPATEDYLIGHLAEHLEAAGRHAELAETVLDLRWTLLQLRHHGPTGVESDLTRIDCPAATALISAIQQNAHLLIPTDPPEILGSILASRLQHMTELKPHVDAFTASLTVPRLVNRWPLADLPHPAAIRAIHGGAAAGRPVVIGPNGEWLTAGSYDGTIRIWDATTGRIRHTLVGHTERVSAVAVAPDGSWLVTGSRDRTARIWGTNTGQQQHMLDGHDAEVTDVVVAPDGTWLATSSSDGTARIWDATTGSLRHVLSGHKDRVNAAAIAPDGRWLATASWDRTARIWDVSTGRLRHILTGHRAEVTDVAIALDGNWLVTCSQDHTARIWDPSSGKHGPTLAEEAGLPIQIDDHGFDAEYDGGWGEVAVAPDGSWVATAPHRGERVIWDVTTRQVRFKLKGHTDHIVAMGIAPDGSWVATASWDNTARIWDTVTGHTLNVLTGHQDQLGGIAVAADGASLATSGFDGTVRIWRTCVDRADRIGKTTNAAPWDPVGSFDTAVSQMAVTPSGNRLVTKHLRQTRVWDPCTGHLHHSVSGLSGSGGPLVIAPDGSWLATAGWPDQLSFWDLIQDQAGPTFSLPRPDLDDNEDMHRYTGMAVAPDGSWLIIGVNDGSALIVDRATGVPRQALAAHRASVDAVAIAPDGTWMLTGSYDGTTRIWDPTTGVCHHTLTALAPVGSAAIAPDATWLVAGCRDGTARTWDAATGRLVHTFAGHDGAVEAVAISRSGHWLATASRVGTLNVWDVEAGALVAAMKVDSHINGCCWFDDDRAIVVTGSRGSFAFNLLT